MRLLKILIILISIASITNANVCTNVLFPKNGSDSENNKLFILNFENAIPAQIFDRYEQAGRKNADFNSLYKIIFTCPAKNKFSHINKQETLDILSNTKSNYSLISLHCLLTI